MAQCSVLQCEEASNASSDPLGLLLIARKLNVEHEVRRMTSGRKRTITNEGLVERALVDASLRNHAILNRHEVNHRHLNKELLWITLREHFCVIVPFASLEINTISVDTRLRLLSNILPAHVRLHDERETDLVDGNCMLSSEVLLGTSKERLWEEEA